MLLNYKARTFTVVFNNPHDIRECRTVLSRHLDLARAQKTEASLLNSYTSRHSSLLQPLQSA